MKRSLLSTFVRGVVSTGLGRGVTLVLGMLSLMLVVRHISAAAYGAFVLIRVVYIVLAEATNCGLTLAVPKYLASSDDINHKFSIVKTVLCFRLAIICGCGIILLMANSLVALLGVSPLMDRYWTYILILFAVESFARLVISILQGLLRFRMIGILSAISAVTNFLATIIFVFPLNLSTIGLIYAVYASDGLLIILGCWMVFVRSEYTKGRGNVALLKEMLRFGAPLQAQYMLDVIFARLDTVIVGIYLGAANVAVYEIARKLPDSIRYLFDGFYTVYFSFLAKVYSEGPQERVSRLLNNSTRMLSFVSSGGALGALLFGRTIIRLLFSAKYLPSYYAFVILMFGLALSATESTLGYSLVAVGEPVKPLIVNFVRAGVNAILNLFITPVFKVMGAAAVAVASNLVAAPIDVYFLRRKNIRAEISAFAKPVVIAGAYGVLFIAAGHPQAPVKVLFMGMFIVTCALMSVITRYDGRIVAAETVTFRNKLWGREASAP